MLAVFASLHPYVDNGTVRSVNDTCAVDECLAQFPRDATAQLPPEPNNLYVHDSWLDLMLACVPSSTRRSVTVLAPFVVLIMQMLHTISCQYLAFKTTVRFWTVHIPWVK
jgi:hypothetical protein